MPTDDVILRIEGLNVDIATRAGILHAVRDVDLTVRRGETLGIVGESGCGKSMTALAVMGLLPRSARRSARRLEFDGVDLLELSPAAVRQLRGNRISIIFQEPMTALNPTFTVGAQLCDVLRQHRNVSTAQARERAVFLLSKVGIDHPEQRLGQYPHQLSGGLRQRIVIAMALMCGPALLLADEPTTALDVTIQAELLRLLGQLRNEFEMTMLLITHDLGVVSRLADHVAVMYAGEVVEYGDVSQIYLRPGHPYTRGLLACLPTPDHPRMTKLASIPGHLPSLTGTRAGCWFYERCGAAMESCAQAGVRLFEDQSGHRVRCLLAEDAGAARYAAKVIS